jgi:rubrerythrin
MKNLQHEDPNKLPGEGNILKSRLHRRSFLRYSGAGVAGLALIAAGCKKNNDFPDDGDGGGGGQVDDKGANLGSGDTGILNYAYVLEQLEAAFYIKMIETPYTGMTPDEKRFLEDVKAHEIAHREVLKNGLGTNAIPTLEFDFSSVDFASKQKVLEAAKAFEDLGVSAYNGAAKLLQQGPNLELAAKIVSVEARHASFIREMLAINTFANAEAVDTTNAFDKSRTPLEVLAIAKPFIKTEINASNLPTS